MEELAMPRGNSKNLKPNTELTPEERKERASKMGKASVAARRKKRDAKETANLILHLAASGQLDQYLEQFGINKQDRTNMTGIVARHVLKAQAGDEKSARLVFELSGDLSKQGGDNNMNVNIGNGEDGVVIYLPEKENDND
jgi:hypothetical protein